MRVLFWGTPDFAVPSLRALLGEGHDVVGVVTQPDRPAGRDRQLRPPPVKEVAREEAIPVLQPERPKGEEFLEHIAVLAPDLSVVVAYGQILRREVLEKPPLGSINVHASLLPQLRGAAPVNWAIVEGHDESGVTIMRMVEKLDAGPILFQVAEPIGADETASELASRLSEIGAEALIEALALLEEGTLVPMEQDESRATYAPKVHRENCRIDWGRGADEIARLLRGMDAVPGAWTMHEGQEVKMYRPLPEPAHAHDALPGTVLDASGTDAPSGLLVACGKGAVHVREVKPAGKRRMTAAEWVRGRSVALGARFG